MSDGSTLPLWDQHICPTIDPSAQLDTLLRYASAATATLGLNVGYAPHDGPASLAVIDSFRERLREMQGVAPCVTVADIDAAHIRGEVAVFFDLEDSRPLDGDAGRLEIFAQRGVRSILTTYNVANEAGSGCTDALDSGLSDLGRAIVRAANRFGVVVDASHVSIDSSMEMFRLSTEPVIYSHTAMRSVWDSPRNITDEQARACAATGGVIGINGVGIFLGANEATLDAMIRHIEYAMDLVGADHVGVGSDYSFDLSEANDSLKQHPELFPAEFSAYGPIRIVEPECTVTLADALLQRGHTRSDVALVVGGNFRRVAEKVWSQ